MSKKLSAKYYQENKERLEKKTCERFQNLSNEKKKKSDKQKKVLNVTKTFLKMKNKSLLSTEFFFERMRKNTITTI